MAASPLSVAGSGAEPAASCSAKLRGILTWGSDRTPSQIKAPAPASGGFKLSPAWQHPVPVDFREFERGALQFCRPRHWWKGVIRTARRQRHLVPLQCGHVGEQRHEAARRQTIGDAPGFCLCLGAFREPCGLQRWAPGRFRGEDVRQGVSGAWTPGHGQDPSAATSFLRRQAPLPAILVVASHQLARVPPGRRRPSGPGKAGHLRPNVNSRVRPCKACHGSGDECPRRVTAPLHILDSHPSQQQSFGRAVTS